MTISIDRNAEFAETKLAQIAREQDKAAAVQRRVDSGELRDNGNGTFTVLTGWDRGETLRLSTVDGSAQILAEHGISEVNGTTALYSRRPAWHGLGEIVPDGMDNIEDILDLIGGPLEYSKEPVFYRDKMTGEFKQVDDVFAAVWMDQDGRNQALRGKTVGKTYKHAQDVEAARFLQDLVGERVVFESVLRLQNNAKFCVGLRLTDEMVIDPQGVADAVAKYLYCVNTHDGSGKLLSMVTPWRMECANTERFGVRDASAIWGVRHTTNWNSDLRQQEARRTLGLVDRYYDQFVKEEEALAHSALEMDAFWEIVHGLDSQGTWEKPEEEKGRGATIYRNRMEKLEILLGENMAHLGRTLYAAERSVTEYLDHHAPRRTTATWGATPLESARRGIALLGEDDDKKTRLHKGLMTLVRR